MGTELEKLKVFLDSARSLNKVNGMDLKVIWKGSFVKISWCLHDVKQDCIVWKKFVNKE